MGKHDSGKTADSTGDHHAGGGNKMGKHEESIHEKDRQKSVDDLKGKGGKK